MSTISGESNHYGRSALPQISDGVLSVQQGSLYPALQRLELQGWILSEWRSTEGNRRARFYSLSRSGRCRLEKETAEFTTAVQRVLRTTLRTT